MPFPRPQPRFPLSRNAFHILQEALDVTVLIDQLDASLTRAQYATILALIMDNFAEPWSVCPPVIEWPKRDPEVEEGVCRNPLKGRRTAQVMVVFGGSGGGICIQHRHCIRF